MEERVRLSILLDIYGELLTEKQRNVLDLYYNQDLSLAEIAEHTSTSRQAVYDIIKRCHMLLVHYEDKLNLMEEKKNIEENKKGIIDFIDSLYSDKNTEVLDKIKNYIMNNI